MSLIRRLHAHPTAPASESSPSPTISSPAPEVAPRLQRRAGGSLQRLSEIQSAPLSSRPTVTAPTSGADGSRSVHRSLRDYLAEDQESHQSNNPSGPTGGTRQPSGKSGLAKLTGKVKKLVGKAKNAAERNFVSSQTSVLGLHTETTVGKPVKMSATRPRPEVLQSRPVPAGTRPEDLPGVPDLKAPQTAARQRKIDATAKAAFNPPTSIAESMRGHLGLGRTKVTPQSVSIAEAMGSEAGLQVHLARLIGQPVHAPSGLARQPAPGRRIRFGAPLRPARAAGRGAGQCVRRRCSPRDRSAARVEGRSIPAHLARRGRNPIAAVEQCRRGRLPHRSDGARRARCPPDRQRWVGRAPFRTPTGRGGCHARCHACRAGAGRHRRRGHAGAAGPDAPTQAGQARAAGMRAAGRGTDQHGNQGRPGQVPRHHRARRKGGGHARRHPRLQGTAGRGQGSAHARHL